MRLENIFRGMTIPGVVPLERKENTTKQLSSDQKSLFVVQNLVGEIVRLDKLVQRIQGRNFNSEINKYNTQNFDQTAIAKDWGVSRTVFPHLLAKIQNTGTLSRKKGTGATISVMTEAVKRKLIHILIKHQGDIDFKTWEEEIEKDNRFTVTPKRESIRKWWINECGGIYVHKKSRPMISEKTAKLRVEFCRKCLAHEELCLQIHQDEGYAFAVRWCRKLKSIKPGMIPDLPLGFKPPKKAIKSRRHTPKIMLSVVIARPEQKEGVGFYGGRVALIRCTKEVVAKNASKNHKKGSIYNKDTSVNSKMFKSHLTKTILPKIKRNKSLLDKSERFAQQLTAKDADYKLPKGCKWADLNLQLDNATPHCKKNKRLFPIIKKAAGRNVLNGIYYGPKVRLVFQPPDSPDLNVLDLGFFTNFWSKIHKILKEFDHIPSLDDVWNAAQIAWENVTPVDIEILYRTLRARMEQVVQCNGRNDMPIPHGGIRLQVEREDDILKKS